MHLPFTLSIMYWSQQLSFLYTKMEVRIPFVHETLDPIQTIRVLYQRSGSFLNYSTRGIAFQDLPSYVFVFFSVGGGWILVRFLSDCFDLTAAIGLSIGFFLIYHCNILQLHISHFYKYIYFIFIVDIVYCIEMLTYTTTDYIWF